MILAMNRKLARLVKLGCLIVTTSEDIDGYSFYIIEHLANNQKVEMEYV